MKKMSMIGNAHLDPVWLWQWQEGYHEAKATFQAALDRLNEYPGFVFTCACADYYRWVEENAPDIFAQIKTRVAEGSWKIVGGMWIQPDMNTPSGESLARQLLYSQRYFQEKFGLTCKTGYNVDSFGHNAMMPQIFKLAGIDNYVWMRPSVRENPNIPEGSMIWESPDGSQVHAHRIHAEYTCSHDLDQKIDKLFELSQRLGQPVMCFYGVGNHGGGPTIKILNEMLDYQKNNPKGGEVFYSSPDDFFEGLKAENLNLPVWKNELQHHASGCYSTHSQSKRLHRQVENALLRMESLGALSCVLTGHKAKEHFVQQAWNNLMFNEFHDIMGGCSMYEAMMDVVTQLQESLSIAAREENAALQKISWQVDTIKGHPLRQRTKEEYGRLWGIRGQGTPVVVFNPHAFEVESTVRIVNPILSARDDAGNPVPVQRIRASRTDNKDHWDGIFPVKVPALGYRLYWVFMEEETAALPASDLTVTESTLENSKLRVTFDPATGAMTSLVRKADGVNALSAPSRAVLIDITHCDTWAHNVFKFDQEAGEFGSGEITVLEQGPLRAVLRVVTGYGASRLDQRYILYAGSDQLEVETHLDMQEKHRMLKLCYPTAYKTDVSEIPYGVLPRTGCGDEEHCQRWVAMQGDGAGLALMNDGKYSYSAPDGELRMTVANTSIFADHYGQPYRTDTLEYMDMGKQTFTCILHPYAGDWSDAGLNRRAALLNRPLPRVVETYHEGPLAGEYSGISLDNAAIEVGTFKRAEDGQGWILRLSETTGKPQTLNADVKLIGRQVQLNFRGFELKTVYLPDDANAAPYETLLTEL